jgi:hypothetical protein
MPFSDKGDIYSLSICFWEITNRLLTGQYALPFDDIENFLNGNLLNLTAYKFKRPKIPPGCPVPIMILMGRCWDAEVGSRPSCNELMEEIDSLENVYLSNKAEWDAAVPGFENQQDNEETDATSEPPSRDSSTDLIGVQEKPSHSPLRRELTSRMRSKSITDLPTTKSKQHERKIFNSSDEDNLSRTKKPGILRRISQIFT